MIVLGIIAIIMTIGLPAFVVNHRKSPMRNSVNDVVDACRNAREAAIYTGETTEMVFRSDDFSISVQKAPPPPPEPVSTNGVPSAAEVALPPPPADPAPAFPGFSGHLAEGVAVKMIGVNLQDAMDAPEVHVRFYPNGTSDEFALILWDGTTGEEQLITTEVITGRVDVKSLNDPAVVNNSSGPKRVLKMK